MDFLSKNLTGGTIIFIGLILIIFSLFNNLLILIYGIPLLIIGLFILFNKNEDKIEKIKGGKNK
jgi:membrane-bound ClpP family serine protease